MFATQVAVEIGIDDHCHQSSAHRRDRSEGNGREGHNCVVGGGICLVV